jgi:hypothetical protein
MVSVLVSVADAYTSKSLPLKQFRMEAKVGIRQHGFLGQPLFDFRLLAWRPQCDPAADPDIVEHLEQSFDFTPANFT